MLDFKKKKANGEVKTKEQMDEIQELNLGKEFEGNKVSPEAQTLFRNLAEIKSAKKTAELLNAYADLADKTDVTTGDMFGVEPPTKGELLNRAIERTKGEEQGNLFEGEVKHSTKDGKKYSNKKKAYYEIPFEDGLKRVVDPAQKDDRSPVFISETPEVFRKIGFTALPMMMNARHTRLNFYSEEEFKNIYGKLHAEEHPHGLHNNLVSIIKRLKNPLMIVRDYGENASDNSVVAIIEMVRDGKRIVSPVKVEGISQGDGKNIDAHIVLTVYDTKNWVEQFINPAFADEAMGKTGIFYVNEEAMQEKIDKDNKKKNPNKNAIPRRAMRLALSSRHRTMQNGVIHTIAEAGIKVKPQTETLQFLRWFGDWIHKPEKASKVVDEDGKPLVVYHGTNANFTAFLKKMLGSKNIFAESAGKAFFFAGSKATAENYTGLNNSDLLALHLNKDSQKIMQSLRDKYNFEDEVKRKDDAYEKFIEEYDNKSGLNAKIQELTEKFKTMDFVKETPGMLEKLIETTRQNLEWEEDADGNRYSSRREDAFKNTETAKRFGEINKKIAEEWQAGEIKRRGLHPHVMELYLDIKNPLVHDFKNAAERDVSFSDLIDQAKKEGRDGVIFKNVKDGADFDTIYAVFEPGQIKSATDNIGTFDPNNPDIRYSTKDNTSDLFDWAEENNQDVSENGQNLTIATDNVKKTPISEQSVVKENLTTDQPEQTATGNGRKRLSRAERAVQSANSLTEFGMRAIREGYAYKMLEDFMRRYGSENLGDLEGRTKTFFRRPWLRDRTEGRNSCRR